MMILCLHQVLQWKSLIVWSILKCYGCASCLLHWVHEQPEHQILLEMFCLNMNYTLSKSEKKTLSIIFLAKLHKIQMTNNKVQFANFKKNFFLDGVSNLIKCMLFSVYPESSKVWHFWCHSSNYLRWSLFWFKVHLLDFSLNLKRPFTLWILRRVNKNVL